MARVLSIAVAAALLVLGVVAGRWLLLRGTAPEPLVVGILHSQTGPMAASEGAVIEATILALEGVNRDGGVLGRPLRWVIADGASDERVFAREAERLLVEEQVSVLFGCWTSASRKAVREVVERYNGLLFYPVQYEGCESSPNIVYLGAAPNQQIIPAVTWGLENLGKRVALVGSDYIFPRVANAIIRDQLDALRGRLAAEVYIPLDATNEDVDAALEVLRDARPDVILNTINGAANRRFFDGIGRLGVGRAWPPGVISFSLAEPEIRDLGPSRRPVGQYAAWNYFQTLDRSENTAFVAAFRQRFGSDRVVSDPMEAAYCGVRLWARAVMEAGTPETARVRAALRHQSLNAPEGVVSIDPDNQHAWKTARIGRIREDGQFEVVWDSRRPVPPLPYPITRSRSAWGHLLDELRASWGGQWSNPSGGVDVVVPATEVSSDESTRTAAGVSD